MAGLSRRSFLAAAGMAAAASAQEKEAVTASASEDATPRVGIVPSGFTGSEDHDGTKVPGLAEPRPADADLTPAQLDAMVRKAVELGASKQEGLKRIFGAEDWIVIKTCIPSFPGAGVPYVPGCATDPRVVRSVLSLLAEQKLGLRFSIVEGAAAWRPREKSGGAQDGWSTDWGGAFDGLSYRALVEEMSKRHPDLMFELVDLNYDPALPMPVPGRAVAPNNAEGTYHVPATIQQCDRVISVAPLKTDAALGVALSLANYLGIAPGSQYGFPKTKLLEMGKPEEVLMDLYGFHPADFAVLGGCWGIEGEGPDSPGGASVHHNLVVAGNKPVAVDAVAAMVMGFDPARLPFLKLAERSGYGILDMDSIWVRGVEAADASRPFRKPSRWAGEAG